MAETFSGLAYAALGNDVSQEHALGYAENALLRVEFDLVGA